jgi:hypothetical protein
MGKPGRERSRSSGLGRRRTTGTETSQYREGREINRDAPSSGERKGLSPNQSACPAGVVGPADGRVEASRTPLERGAEDGESPVGEGEVRRPAVFLSSARPEKSGAKPGGPPSKAKGLPCDR